MQEGELEILEFLNSKGFNFVHDNELGSYDEKAKAAIEYCGLYFHSGFTKSGVDLRKCHINKHIEATQKGIRLFTIFEHEWRDRQPQVKAYLLGALGVYQRKFNARDCLINDNMDKNVTKEFLEGWHIQGTCNFEFAVGIYANKGIMGNYGELLGVITFGQHQRQGFADVSVLNRLCWKEGISVIGGAKRMLHHALKRYSQGKKIVTWSDNRWSAGGLYERLGFTLETEYGPDYFYTNKNNVVASKQSKQKKHLKALPHETEVVAARRQGWERIWDCGKKKWTLVIGKINLPHQKQFHES